MLPDQHFDLLQSSEIKCYKEMMVVIIISTKLMIKQKVDHLNNILRILNYALYLLKITKKPLPLIIDIQECKQVRLLQPDATVAFH